MGLKLLNEAGACNFSTLWFCDGMGGSAAGGRVASPPWPVGPCCRAMDQMVPNPVTFQPCRSDAGITQLCTAVRSGIPSTCPGRAPPPPLVAFGYPGDHSLIGASVGEQPRFIRLGELPA